MVKYNNKNKYRRSSKKGTYKKSKVAPKSKSSLVKLIKSVTMKQSETKFKSRDLIYSTMAHDSIVKIPIWDKDAIFQPKSILPQQGITDATRIGDRIMASKIKLRLHFDIPYDRNNVKLKLYFLEYNSDQGTPTDYATFFHNVTGNSRLDPVQFKRWGKYLKYLGDYRPRDNDARLFYTYHGNESAPSGATTATNTSTIYVKKDIYLNRKVYFTSDGAMTPSNLKENGCLLILPYASANTSTGDNVVLSMEGASTLYYKDL